jgi:hypothetical protein
MNFVLITAAMACIALGAAIFLVLRKISLAGRRLPVTAEWIDELSVERYRPMLRLLDGEDLQFLRSQPGFTPQMADKLRVQRCQVFRGYLRCLSTDFSRTCAGIKLLMLQSRRDRPDLAAVLIRHQMLFAVGIMVVQCRLMLFQAGLCTVDANGLVRIFDLMRLELRTLVPSAVAAGA